MLIDIDQIEREAMDEMTVEISAGLKSRIKASLADIRKAKIVVANLLKTHAALRAEIQAELEAPTV